MSALSNKETDNVIRLIAGGLALTLIGCVFFMATADMEDQTDRVTWTWFFIALGVATATGSGLVGQRSQGMRVVLRGTIAVLVVSIVVLRAVLTITT